MKIEVVANLFDEGLGGGADHRVLAVCGFCAASREIINANTPRSKHYPFPWYLWYGTVLTTCGDLAHSTLPA